jgi:hypothetical protein
VPKHGVVVEGVKGIKYTPMPLEMYKNGEKTGCFPNFSAYKLPKTPFSLKKYLTRYTPEFFFDEYIILKFFIT